MIEWLEVEIEMQRCYVCVTNEYRVAAGFSKANEEEKLNFGTRWAAIINCKWIGMEHEVLMRLNGMCKLKVSEKAI